MLKTKQELKQILEPILKYLDQIEEFIAKEAETNDTLVRMGAKQVFRNPGKKVRASFVMLGAAMGQMQKGYSQEDMDLSGAIPLGAGVELVHAATLVHDDIIDNAHYRRGVQTVSRRWDSKVAVLLGDWMFTRGLHIAAAEKEPHIMPLLIEATSGMVKGELIQVEYSSLESINLANYHRIIDFKTAQFLGACIEVGALNQEMPLEDAHKLYQFGYHTGLGFQIVDDLMDFSQKGLTGKDVGNDYYDGKVTLPVIFLYEKYPEYRQELKRLYQSKTKENFARLKAMVAEKETLAMAMEEARGQIKKGLAFLDEFDASFVTRILRNLSDFVISRSY